MERGSEKNEAKGGRVKFMKWDFKPPHCDLIRMFYASLTMAPPPPLFFSSLLQGSQDSTGGPEGLVATPFSAFPPPPPPQNGLAGAEFGPGAMFAAGGQGTAEVGVGANVAGGSGSSNSNSSNSINVSKHRVCFHKP